MSGLGLWVGGWPLRELWLVSSLASLHPPSLAEVLVWEILAPLPLRFGHCWPSVRDSVPRALCFVALWHGSRRLCLAVASWLSSICPSEVDRPHQQRLWRSSLPTETWPLRATSPILTRTSVGRSEIDVEKEERSERDEVETGASQGPKSTVLRGLCCAFLCVCDFPKITANGHVEKQRPTFFRTITSNSFAVFVIAIISQTSLSASLQDNRTR